MYEVPILEYESIFKKYTKELLKLRDDYLNNKVNGYEKPKDLRPEDLMDDLGWTDIITADLRVFIPNIIKEKEEAEDIIANEADDYDDVFDSGFFGECDNEWLAQLTDFFYIHHPLV